MKSEKRPAVCWWLKVYCVVMLVVQGTIIAFFARVVVDPVTNIKDEMLPAES